MIRQSKLIYISQLYLTDIIQDNISIPQIVPKHPVNLNEFLSLKDEAKLL